MRKAPAWVPFFLVAPGFEGAIDCPEGAPPYSGKKRSRPRAAFSFFPARAGWGLALVGRVRFELTTIGLKVRCSTN